MSVFYYSSWSPTPWFHSCCFTVKSAMQPACQLDSEFIHWLARFSPFQQAKSSASTASSHLKTTRLAAITTSPFMFLTTIPGPVRPDLWKKQHLHLLRFSPLQAATISGEIVVWLQASSAYQYCFYFSISLYLLLSDSAHCNQSSKFSDMVINSYLLMNLLPHQKLKPEW